MTESNAAGDAFNDSLNFVKKLWGTMGVPGMAQQGMTIPGMPSMAPSMSIEDMDKRIQELKTVETWLNVNMQMLRGTIQALEVQRATIATLHSLSTTMANSMNPGAAAAAFATEKSDSNGDRDAVSAEEVSPLIAQSAAWWQGVQEQFKHALGTALEKSSANFEAARSASEDIVKAATVKAPAKTSRPAARAKPAVKAKPKAKAGTTRTRKAG